MDTATARKVVAACYLGWALDAFDFFIMVFIFSNIAETFGVSLTTVTVAVTLTLAMRPIGAFLFGRIADRYGRRPALMICILAYSVLEFASGFAPTLYSFLVLRALFGIAMGGEWGIGSSLAMESIPARWRGWVSGLLQSGYPTGYFLATLVYHFFLPMVGWRGLFMIGAVPALLAVFIYRHVPESPGWIAERSKPRLPLHQVLHKHLGLTIYAVALLTAMNFFSHGTQDIYPNIFLKTQHGFDQTTITHIALAYNAAAIICGIFCGFLSQHIGRRRTIMLFALLALPVIPMWAFGNSALALEIGAILIQICMQGAWSVMPAHLNELSPPSIRATFPGFVYQLGNLFASYNTTLQTSLGERSGNYSWALAGVVGIAVVTIAILIAFSPEAREAVMDGSNNSPAPSIPVE